VKQASDTTHPGRRISPEAARVLLEAVDTQSIYDLLTALGGRGADCLRGFKVNPRSRPKGIVRQRIAHEVARHDEWRELLTACTQADWNRYAAALYAFDERWLLRQWRLLVRDRTSLVRLAAGLALQGDRADLVALGERLLARRSLWEGETRLRHLDGEGGSGPLRALRDLIGEPASATTGDEQVEALEHRVQTLKHELDQLRHARERQKQRARESLAEAEERVRALTEECRGLRHELRDRDAELAAVRAQIEERVRDGVNVFRRQVLGLNAEFESLNRNWEPDRSAALHEQARQALDEQHRHNERYGLVHRIREDLHRLCQARDEIAACVAESVVVLPATAAVRDRLEERIRNLRTQLHAVEPEAENELTHELRAAIRATGPEEDSLRLERIQGWLDTEVTAEVLDAGSLELLREELQRRRARLRELEHEVALATTASAGQESGPAEGGGRTMEVWNVRDALGEAGDQQRPVLLVDGYNVTKNVERLAREEETTGLSGSRMLLEERLAMVAAAFDSCEIVYDGDQAVDTRESRKGLTIVFAAKRRPDQNADLWIQKRAVQLTQTGRRVWLVTADQGLRQAAAPVCEAFIYPADIARFLALSNA
jgi:hypothetical protein